MCWQFLGWLIKEEIRKSTKTRCFQFVCNWQIRSHCWTMMPSAHAVWQDLDQLTRVPHLLLEIRSLGFVEIQGKDTGGIYKRLGEWLVEHWKMEEKREDIVRVCNDNENCRPLAMITIFMFINIGRRYSRVNWLGWYLEGAYVSTMLAFKSSKGELLIRTAVLASWDHVCRCPWFKGRCLERLFAQSLKSQFSEVTPGVLIWLEEIWETLRWMLWLEQQSTYWRAPRTPQALWKELHHGPFEWRCLANKWA